MSSTTTTSEVDQKAADKAIRKATRKAARKLKRKAEAEGQQQQQEVPAKKEKKAKQTVYTESDNEAYLAAHEIAVHDERSDSPPVLCRALCEAPFPAPLVSLLVKQKGFTEPSAVQAAAWPIAAAGRDVLAIAKTGSGKTLGFLLPVLARIHDARHQHPKGDTPLGLIMAPTRELALQIHAEAVKFGKNSFGCRSVAVYGGASRGPQVSALRRGCDLIIGTPGRIKDVLFEEKGLANSMSMLVLDEADRMLDMGFERDIRDIVWRAFRERPRQTFFFSATWPLEVQDIAHDLLSTSNTAVKVTVGSGGDKLTANKSVTQRVHVVGAQETLRMKKFEELMQPFRRGGKDAGKRVIVFANMKFTVKKLVQYCQRQGLATDEMSGNRNQSQREATIRKFKEGKVMVVIATDVAARGLDIKGIERVINYELPASDFQDYVHRIGRTGRAGATGEADSLFTDGDRQYAKELIRIMKEAGQEVPPLLAKYAPTKIVFDYGSDYE